MKKQAATDAKNAAANDKPENGKAEKAKRVKPAEDAKYTVGNLATVKRGFLLALCEFVKAKGRSETKSPQPHAQCDQAGDRHRTGVASQGSGRRAEAQTRVSPTGALDPADSQRFAEGVARSPSFALPPP
jgi:hypothetical protein